MKWQDFSNWTSEVIWFWLHPVPLSTGKSLSEALIFASTNPQYDDRLFIELQVQYMKIPSSNLGRTCCVQNFFLTFRTIFVHNMFSPCSAKRRASDKDLPVPGQTFIVAFGWNYLIRCHLSSVTGILIKVHLFWEGHKILRNLHLTFEWH